MPHLVMHQIPPAAGAWVSTFEDGIPRWFQSRRPRCPPDHDSARRTSRHLPRPCCGVRIQRHICPPLRRWRVLTHGHGGRPAVQRRGVTAPSPWRQLTGNGCSFPNGSDCSGFPFPGRRRRRLPSSTRTAWHGRWRRGPRALVRGCPLAAEDRATSWRASGCGSAAPCSTPCRSRL
jgi:hypothetical protein